MRIKKALMCGALAAAVMLTGCSENKNTSSAGSELSSGYTPPGNAASGSNSAAGEYKVNSAKPAEIEGFDGNVKDIAPKSGDLIAAFEIEDYGTIKAVLFPQAAPTGVENFQKLCDAGFYKGLTIHRVIEDFMFQGGSTNGDGTGGDAMVNGGSFGIETAQNARHFYGALCYANAAGQNSTQFYIVNNKNAQDIGKYDVDGNQKAIDDAMDDLNKNAKQYSKTVIDKFLFDVQYAQNTVDFMRDAGDEIKTRYMEKGGTPSLDGNYTVFGQVYEGFDVIDAISSAEVKDNGTGQQTKPVKDIVIKNVTVTVYE